MSVYIAIFVGTCATAYLLVRLYRFLTRRHGSLQGQKGSASVRRHATGRSLKPALGVLAPASVRGTAANKRVTGKRSQVLNPGNIKKPWGW